MQPLLWIKIIIYVATFIDILYNIVGQTDIELIGGVTGAIVFILLCLIAICIVITVILCIKMKL